MKIFISGKITGEPIWDCMQKFSAVERDWYYGSVLREVKDASFIDPLLIKGIHFGISHDEAMRLCFKELKNCDAIYMLKCWKDSKGAKMEHQMAKELGIKIYYEKQ